MFHKKFGICQLQISERHKMELLNFEGALMEQQVVVFVKQYLYLKNTNLYLDYSQDLQTRSNSETSLVSSNLGSNQLDFFNDDTECLIQSGGNSPSRLKAVSQIGVGGRRLSSAVATNKTFGGSLFSLPQPTLEPGVFRSLNYPAFQSLRIEKVNKLFDNF